MRALARDGQLACYRHDGFWEAMDTMRDRDHLERLWSSGGAPWRVWAMSASYDPDFWRGRRVLITGHTGFKGAWLSLWLQSLGASVTGFAGSGADEALAL